MIKILLSPNTYIGFAFAALIVGGWGVAIHGPKQYKAGGDAAALKLTIASQEASKGLSDAAERNRLLFAECRNSGGVWDHSGNGCKR